MSKITKLLLLIVLVLAVTGFYRRWYRFSASTDSLSLGLDSKRLDDDINRWTDAPPLQPSGQNLPAPGNAASPAQGNASPAAPAGPGTISRLENQPPKMIAGKEDRALTPSLDDRVEGIVTRVAEKMPRFTIRVKDEWYMTFDLAPKGEVRRNDALSDFRVVRRGVRVTVLYYPDATTENTPPRYLARTINIELPKLAK